MIYDVDWTQSMQQSFSFYKVNPNTWRDEERLDTILSAEIVRDSEEETLGYATFSADDIEGEFYIRTYMDVTQNGKFYHIPLSTNLTQTSISGYDGKRNNLTIDSYTPLIELKEKNPPIGFYFDKGDNILEKTKSWTDQLCRAPVLDWKTPSWDITVKDENGFVSENDETWMTFLTAFLKNAKHVYRLTELGEIYFDEDNQSVETQSVFTYSDDGLSILYPEISMTQDLYDIPNVVELVISKPDMNRGLLIRAVNDNPNSIISTVKRGREIVTRINDPDITGYNNEAQFQQLAEKLLDDLSSVEYILEYKHGFCPVKLGDCVTINYKKANLRNIRAKVIKQTITCEPGCPVNETASYTVNLRR